MANNPQQFNMPVVLKPSEIQNQEISIKNPEKHQEASLKEESTQINLEDGKRECEDSQLLSLEQEEIIHIFMCLVTKLIEGNTKPNSMPIKEKQNCLVAIKNMFHKIYRLVKGQDSCFVTAMILLDRIHSLNENLRLNFENIRLYISAALLVAFKYCDDYACYNSQLAESAEIDRKILNQMEIRFLGLLNFELYIDPSTYERYEKKILNYSQRKKRSFMCNTQ